MNPSDLDLFGNDYDADASLDDGYSPHLDARDFERGGAADDWSASDGDFSISADL